MPISGGAWEFNNDKQTVEKRTSQEMTAGFHIDVTSLCGYGYFSFISCGIFGLRSCSSQLVTYSVKARKEILSDLQIFCFIL